MKLGIALGGGGARGFAHLGILKVLTELGYDFSVVSGTSIGSLVGACYAADRLKELENTGRSIRLLDIPLLLSPSWSMHGAFSGKNIMQRLSEVIGVQRIEDLPKKYAAVSCDLSSGEKVIQTTGELSSAIRASISIPAVFTPVVRDGKVLVDGSLVDPVPVQACRMLGADFVVAVDLFGGSPLLESIPSATEKKSTRLLAAGVESAIEYLHSISTKLPFWGRSEEDSMPQEEAPAGHKRSEHPRIPQVMEVIEHTLTISQALLTKSCMLQFPPDFLFAPPIKGSGLLDFHRSAGLIEAGEQYARELAPRLSERLAALSK